MSGYSFAVDDEGRSFVSGWLGSDRIFTTPEFQRRYDEVNISLFTPKCALVPSHFFSPESARSSLSEVVRLRDTDAVEYKEIPGLGAVLVYSNSIDESLSRVISQTVLTTEGKQVPVYPEMYYLLCSLDKCAACICNDMSLAIVFRNYSDGLVCSII